MADSNKTMTFATDLVPQDDNTYNLGKNGLRWIIRGSLPLSDITGADGLKVIEGLSGTSGLLRKSANTWELDTSTYLTSITAITAPAVTTNKWVSSIGQGADGKIAVSYSDLDTSGTWAGFIGKGSHTNTITANEFNPAVGTLTLLGNVSNTTMSKTSNANAEMIIKANSTESLNNETHYYEARLGFSSDGNLYYMPVDTTGWKQIAYTSTIELSGDTVGQANSDGEISTTTTKITSLGKLTSANINTSDDAYKNKLVMMYCSSSMDTSTSPSGHGYILSFGGWDDTKCGAQLYIENTKDPRLEIRGASEENETLVWGNWKSVSLEGHTHAISLAEDNSASQNVFTLDYGTNYKLTAGGSECIFATPESITYSTVSKSAEGLCPQLPNETTTTKFLCQDGNWVVPSHHTAYLRAGVENGTANHETTTGKTYLLLVENGQHRSGVKLIPGSNMSITSDASGNVTFTSSYIDTKNTAGSTNSTDKLFLIGATDQKNTYYQTYSNQYVFEDDGELSAKTLGINAGTTADKVTLQWNNSALEFVFT